MTMNDTPIAKQLELELDTPVATKRVRSTRKRAKLSYSHRLRVLLPHTGFTVDGKRYTNEWSKVTDIEREFIEDHALRSRVHIEVEEVS